MPPCPKSSSDLKHALVAVATCLTIAGTGRALADPPPIKGNGCGSLPPHVFDVPCGRRPDVNLDLDAQQRLQLGGLLRQYLTEAVISEHAEQGEHGNPKFIPWHRGYIEALEDFLSAQGFPQFVPLPKWNPANPIPPELCDIDPDCPGMCPPLNDLDPEFPLPHPLTYPELCSYATLEELRTGTEGSFINCGSGDYLGTPGLEPWHGCVHVRVGGTMALLSTSPGAVIFMLWHAFVDDVAYCWQCECNVGPACDTITLPPPSGSSCIEELRAVVEELPRHYGRNNTSLLVKVDRAEAQLRAGQQASAVRTLEALLNEASGLARNDRWNRYPYHAVAETTGRCLESLRTP